MMTTREKVRIEVWQLDPGTTQGRVTMRGVIARRITTRLHGDRYGASTELDRRPTGFCRVSSGRPEVIVHCYDGIYRVTLHGETPLPRDLRPEV